MAEGQIRRVLADLPAVLGKLVQGKDAERSKRVMQALLKMTKIDIKTLKQA
jgi:predicted 3-demethylubiquinone-9 3-methyltransferase (glyoxalase superfamily)